MWFRIVQFVYRITSEFYCNVYVQKNKIIFACRYEVILCLLNWEFNACIRSNAKTFEMVFFENLIENGYRIRRSYLSGYDFEIFPFFRYQHEFHMNFRPLDVAHSRGCFIDKNALGVTQWWILALESELDSYLHSIWDVR